MLRLFQAGALALLLGLTASAHGATTIISDTFSGSPQGTALTSHTPNVNLPGGSWVNDGQPGAFTPTFIDSPGSPTDPLANVGPANGSAITIASNGGYIKPSLLTISAGISTGTNSGTTADRGTALGFFSSPTTSINEFNPNFRGLAVNTNGSLTLINGTTTGPSVAYAGGTYSAAAGVLVSYDVNTTTGNISNISVSGSTADYSSLATAAAGLFTDAATQFAGVADSAPSGANRAFFENFTVTGVPEPTTLGLIALSGLTFLKRRR